ncbi:MAG: hypothetical protein M1818_007008 [Claussenomyces sp. TS43310]|nr:MAG: hypothetical protein M1818_007008 [Claussenomyces sp. TS43310]
MLNIAFDRLDFSRIGFLSPEQYSSFLDAQGYSVNDDVWKRSLRPTLTSRAEELADFELRSIYENFSIDHKLQQRNVEATDMNSLATSMSQMMSPGADKLLTQSDIPVSGGYMPMLTRQGFIDITVVETLYNPSLGWQRLNRIARHYGIWREMGDIPRTALPEGPPQELVDRVARIAEYSKRKVQEQLDAKIVEHALARQGSRAALDSIEGPYAQRTV